MHWDGRMSASSFKKALYHAVMDLLWRQWSQLGVPGQMSTGGALVLDPEALLLFSARFCRYDQRLYDLLPEWMLKYGLLINIQRLKALYAAASWKDAASLGYLASLASREDKDRWRKPADDFRPSPDGSPGYLFLDWQDSAAMYYIPNMDNGALNYGFQRGKYQHTGKVMSGIPDGTASLLLRMRALFGVSARCETILLLLDKGCVMIQEVADRSGFAWKSIQDVLMALECSGLVSVVSGIKRGKHYILKNPEKMKSFLGIKSCRLPNWAKLYEALGILWDTVSNPRLAALSDMTFQGECARVFEEKLQGLFIRTALENTGLTTLHDISKLPHLLEGL